MGQLEKYGLYVLCLVIFLILGVTIWGNPERGPGGERVPNAAIRAAEGAGARSVPTADGGKAPPAPRPGEDGLARELESLIGPTARSSAPPVTQDPVGATPPKPVADKPSADAVPDVAANGAADTKRGSYLVQSGDSFDSIARLRLGSAALRDELQRLNPKVVPSKMRVGQELVLPSPAELARLGKLAPSSKDAAAQVPAAKVVADKKADKKTAVEAAADRSYTIGKGDTFERIARAELGSSKRVEELRELNPTVDPTRLRIGQRIKLPKP